MKGIMKLLGGLSLATGLLLGADAHAAVTGNLVFKTPNGTVSPTDSIDIWVTLTLDPTSDPLTYFPNDPFPQGVDPDDLPVEGYEPTSGQLVPFSDYFYVNQSIFRTCSDTFTNGCNDPGSEYSWSAASGTGENWLDFEGTINPGGSMDFRIYTLTPADGSASPGTYEAFTVGVALGVEGQDSAGNPLHEDVYAFSTDCAGPECTFTRTVVPLPGAVWFLGSGLVALIGWRRRR